MWSFPNTKKMSKEARTEEGAVLESSRDADGLSNEGHGLVM